MSVYVGTYGTIWRGKTWYHLLGDTEAELHRFAGGIGLLRSWYQVNCSVPHYDVTEGKRTVAVEKGAVVLNTVEESDMLKTIRRRCRDGSFQGIMQGQSSTED